MIRHRLTAVSALLALLLLVAPLPFGSVSPTPRTLLWGAVVVIFLLACWSGEVSGVWGSARAPVLLLLGVAGLALLQSFAWPRPLASVISPGHVELATTARAGIAASDRDPPSIAADQEAATPSWVMMSFSPQSSRRSAVGWAVMALALFCGAAMRSRGEVRVVLAALVGAAVLQALYGAPHILGEQDLIWGREMAPAQGRLRGTFVNPNHAAFCLGMAIPVVTAWGWLSGVRFKDGDYQRLGVLRAGVPWLVWLVLASAVLLTQSRAGVLVLILALAVQLFLLLRRSLRTALFVTAILAAGGLGLVLGGTGDGLLERVEETRSSASPGGARVAVYAATLDLWKEFPVVGGGLGSFRTLFAARGPSEVSGQWWNAHSDWIELLATGGLLSLGLVVAALFVVVKRLWRRLDSRSRERRAIAVAVLGVIAAAALHSLVDFGLAMPANSVALALVVGVGIAPRRVSKTRHPGT